MAHSAYRIRVYILIGQYFFFSFQVANVVKMETTDSSIYIRLIRK